MSGLPTHVEMHFVSSLLWDGFSKHMMRCILMARWRLWGLVNLFSDAFFVFCGMGWVWAIQIDMHFVWFLALDTFCFLVVMGWV